MRCGMFASVHDVRHVLQLVSPCIIHIHDLFCRANRLQWMVRNPEWTQNSRPTGPDSMKKGALVTATGSRHAHRCGSATAVWSPRKYSSRSTVAELGPMSLAGWGQKGVILYANWDGSGPLYAAPCRSIWRIINNWLITLMVLKKSWLRIHTWNPKKTRNSGISNGCSGIGTQKVAVPEDKAWSAKQASNYSWTKK